MISLSKIKTQNDTRIWICSVLLFIISYPQWLWQISSGILIEYASLALLVLAYKDISNTKAKTGCVLAWLLQSVLIFEYSIYSYSNLSAYIAAAICGISFGSLFLCTVGFWKKTTDCFIQLLALLLIPSFIEYILVTFMGVNIVAPSFFECPINGERTYQGYLFTVFLEYSFDYFGRFYGFYDEPGVLGNILMVLLYINKFDLHKWYNVVFLVCGLFSFSLAFYIALITYFVLFGTNRHRIIFAIISILAIYFFYDNEYVYNYVFRRAEIENGVMVGYNRENIDFESWFKKLELKQFFWWGYQPREKVAYAASWQWALALYGVVPSIVYLVALVMSRVKNVNCRSDILKGLVLIFIIFVQRPFFHRFLYVYLMLIPLLYFSDAIVSKKTEDLQY